jgi:excisionase family DNA binding protein
VAEAVAHEVTALKRKSASASAVGAATTPMPGTTALGARIKVLVTRVLEQSLTSPTAQGKALRMALIAKLAHIEAGGSGAAQSAQASAADSLLTTAEAAARLEVSRPYVSMLCDYGKLGEVVMTEGGHRRIRASAVEAYLGDRTILHKAAAFPRQAGIEAGLYNFSDGHSQNVVRGATPQKLQNPQNPTKPSKQSKKAAPSKVSSKSRS